MKLTSFIPIAATAIIGYAAVQLFINPEAREAKRQAKEANRQAKEAIKQRNAYWSAFLETRDLGVERSQAILNYLDPLAPSSLFSTPGVAPELWQLNYPYLGGVRESGNFSPIPYPGLPTLEEWTVLLDQKFNEWARQEAQAVALQGSSYGSWPVAQLF